MPVNGQPLWARVRALPEKQRMAVFLRSVADLSYADVARHARLLPGRGATQRPRGAQEAERGDGGMTGPGAHSTDLARAAAHRRPAGRTLSSSAERAEREGLLDVAYAQVDSPLGPLTAAATKRGLVTARLPRPAARRRAGAHRQGGLAAHPRGTRAARPAAARARRVLRGRAAAVRDADRLAGSRRGSSRPCSAPRRRSATARCAATPTSPRSAGSPKAVRAAGNGLGSNPMPVVVPCHRVVASGGELGGYTGGIERKEFLLDLERR